MAWDIYGERLERGHCEVHPWVHEEYPCPVCISESRQKQQERNEYDRAMREEYEKAMHEEMVEALQGTNGDGI